MLDACAFGIPTGVGSAPGTPGTGHRHPGETCRGFVFAGVGERSRIRVVLRDDSVVRPCGFGSTTSVSEMDALALHSTRGLTPPGPPKEVMI